MNSKNAEDKRKIILKALTNKDKAIKENNLDEYIKNMYILFNINYADYDFYLKDVNYLINFDINESTKFLNKIEEKYKINNFKIAYLKNKIKEYQEENLEIIDYFITKGKKAYKAYDLKYALVIYYVAFEITNNNIFNYYIGKIQYKLKEYEKAKIYLNKYVENGSKKHAKSLLYLCMIEKKNKKDISKYIEKMNIINSYENNDFELCFYMKDKKVSKKIKMKEEEFRK